MPSRTDRPLLVFDGDCSFCRLWIGYWNKLTGDAVDYAPYQSAAARFPDVPVDAFKKAVQLFENGRRYSGAEAVAHLLARVEGWAWARWLYAHIPGLASLAELAYRFVAAHRNAGYKITRALWGSRPEPAAYTLAASLFSRTIAFIYLIAFISFGRQARGLIGEKGVQPVTQILAELHQQLGASAVWRVPTLFWWANSEYALLSIVWGGAVLAFVAAIAKPHTGGQKAAFFVLFLYYLSIVNGGQIFTSYQWDYLLLEAGFLALFLKPVWSRVWLFRWLLFRLLFQSGVVKLASGDLTWHNLTALAYHYETQPLPTPLAWYAFHFPMWFQQFSTFMVLAMELTLPFLIFGPRRLKQIAATGIIFLELLIALTGNYNFFNLLTIALCLFLFDDAFLSRYFGPRPGAVPRKPWRDRPVKPLRSNRRVSAVLVTVILVISLPILASSFNIAPPAALRSALSWPATYGLVNGYGLFANMTTTRPEISLEGSNDNTTWEPYVFLYKPGPLNRAPGSQPVLDLLGPNPFPAAPPKYIRAMIYQYRFTTSDERRRTGNWWKRDLLGQYFPPISLRDKP